jgi:hypothetical protein
MEILSDPLKEAPPVSAPPAPGPPTLAGRLTAGTLAGIYGFVLGLILSKMICGG